jgi:hypothetical protein
VLALCALSPLADAAVIAIPVRSTNYAWWFGFLGAFASAVSAVVLLLVLALGIAAYAEDRAAIGVIRRLGACLFGASMVALVGFAASAVAFHRRVPEPVLASFTQAVSGSVLKYVLTALGGLAIMNAFRDETVDG